VAFRDVDQLVSVVCIQIQYANPAANGAATQVGRDGATDDELCDKVQELTWYGGRAPCQSKRRAHFSSHQAELLSHAHVKPVSGA
jgi:hypothetical protein